MAKILYAGHTIAMPHSLNVDEFAAALEDSYAKGGHTWATFDLPGDRRQQVRLLFGPGIPVGFVTDETDGHVGGDQHGTSEPFVESTQYPSV